MEDIKVLWLCSWFPNDEDKFRGDFIMRQAEALANDFSFELLHFVEYASKNEIDYSNLNGNCAVTIGYSKSKNKLLSFKAQWSFYNKELKKYIQKNGKPDLVHLHIPWKAGLVVRYWFKKHKIPYIISEHYGIYNEHTQDNFFTKSKRVQRYYKKIFSTASRVITVSKSLGEEIKTIFQKPVFTIPNVVKTDSFYFENISVKETFSFLHISNMYDIKNVEEIIQAFFQAYKKDNSLRLKLVGATPTNIQSKIEDLGCKNAIELSGEISYEEVGAIMQDHHAFVLFSDWETQSCVALEALCSGRPVITSRVGGVQELVNPRNGILVEAGNVNALAEAMMELKNNYGQYHLEQISIDAQEEYSYNTVAKKLKETYKEVLGF